MRVHKKVPLAHRIILTVQLSFRHFCTCRWAFDATNPTAHAAWRAFHDHVQTPASSVVNSHVWNPKVIAG